MKTAIILACLIVAIPVVATAQGIIEADVYSETCFAGAGGWAIHIVVVVRPMLPLSSYTLEVWSDGLLMYSVNPAEDVVDVTYANRPVFYLVSEGGALQIVRRGAPHSVPCAQAPSTRRPISQEARPRITLEVASNEP